MINVRMACLGALTYLGAAATGFGQTPAADLVSGGVSGASSDLEGDLPTVTVTATREVTPLERSPSSTTVISGEEIAQRQYRFATEALRTVPGLTVTQTGTAGQLTSVFIRGNRSDQTAVLLNGIPINQSLSGAFNFADLTTDDLERIEVVRGSQSAVYGGRASGGVINLITKRGTTPTEGSVGFEGGSYDSYRETGSGAGRLGAVDFAVGASRFDSDNARQNNAYRNTSFLGDAGVNAAPGLRLGLLAAYRYADAGSPNTIFDPRPYDNLRTESFQLAPHAEWAPADWWRHSFYVSYDQERQINNPNEDGFTGPTRGIFRRTQLEYQNVLTPGHFLALTSGFYYAHTNVYQERPEILAGARLIRDKTENVAGFAQLKAALGRDLDVYLNGRYDAFRDYGSKATYRVAANYRLALTGTILRASYGTGFTPPSSQDVIFGNNPDLRPDRERFYEVGMEQGTPDGRFRAGLNWFHETTTREIGFNPDFTEVNLGSARNQGIEAFAVWVPLEGVTLTANYTYLDSRNTGSLDANQPVGARLIRRPRNAYYVSASYTVPDRWTATVEVQGVNAREERRYDADFQPVNFDVEDYVTVRLSAEWHVWQHVTLTGRIENLLGEKYAEVYGYPALGRVFYGGVSVRF